MSAAKTTVFLRGCAAALKAEFPDASEEIRVNGTNSNAAENMRCLLLTFSVSSVIEFKLDCPSRSKPPRVSHEFRRKLRLT